MRADITGMLGPIAIKAEELKFFLWKVVLTKPLVEFLASFVAKCTTVFCSIIIHMIYSEKFRTLFAAASANSTIGGKYFLAKSNNTRSDFSMPLWLISQLMWTGAIDMFCKVTILAKKLKFILRETILTKPKIEVPIQSAAVLRSPAIDVINRKKNGVCVTAADAFASISFKNLLTKLIPCLLVGSLYMLRIVLNPFTRERETVLAPMPRHSRTNKARGTHPGFSSSRAGLARILSLLGSKFLLFFRGFSELISTLFGRSILKKVRITSSLGRNYIVLTGFAVIVQKVFLFAVSRKMLLSSRKPFVTFGTELLKRYLEVQRFKIKGVLSEVFWYTGIHKKLTFLITSPDVFVSMLRTLVRHCGDKPYSNLPHQYTTNPLPKQVYSIFLVLKRRRVRSSPYSI